MRRLLSLLLLGVSLLTGGAQGLPWTVSQQPPPKLRALLVGCDRFVSQEDTWPAADNSLWMMADALMTDSRGYALIRTASGTLASQDELQRMIRATFQNAEPQDVSLLYFSTHGVLLDTAEGVSAALLLSDGQRECAVSAAVLEEMLEEIPGKKALIFDACNSGAMIGKGMNEANMAARFLSPNYRVLCSAGGSEASWFWQGKDGTEATGASYFAQALTAGLDGGGGCAADENRDGLVTLAEMYRFLLDNCAVSTPHAYPQQDDSFVLYAYDPDQAVPAGRAVTNMTFDDTLLTAGESQARFSFTVRRQVELYYQVIYHGDGAWQFGEAQQYLDGEQADGTVLPGRKQRTISLNTAGLDDSGYAMIQLITREDGRTVYQGARLLCVRPAEGTVRLEAATLRDAFVPSMGQEMPILIRHDVPCGLSVSIQDETGRTVCRLAYDVPTRPEQLTPAASSFYWNGLLSDGTAAPPGRYRAAARTEIGGVVFEAKSQTFELLEK